MTRDEYIKNYAQENREKIAAYQKEYGSWHIDHIKPCAKFDLSKIEEQKACFHFTNLQPLWASDNLRKSAKYEVSDDR